MSNRQHSKDAAIAEALKKMGFTVAAEFIPFTKSRNAQEGKTFPVAALYGDRVKPSNFYKPGDLSINWRVTVTHKRGTYSTDYQEGIGHLPEHLQSKSGGYTTDAWDALCFAVEQGKAPRVRPSSWNIGAGAVPLTPPTPGAVFYSISMDSDAALMSFEEWASNFGMDTDSREAEQTYKACQEQGYYLLKCIGPEGLEKLQTLFQDY